MMELNLKMVVEKLLAKVAHFDCACVLLSNGFEDVYGEFEIMAGFGAKKTYSSLEEMDTESLKFGFIAYDYKNKIEKLESNNDSVFVVPELFYFEPEFFYLLARTGEVISNINLNAESGLSEPKLENYEFDAWEVPNEKHYKAGVEDIREQIRLGEFYELNYCNQWSSKVVGNFYPTQLFMELNRVAPAPFSCFLKYQDHYLLCSSPERFLKKSEDKLISQPIKGTRKRGENEHADKVIRTELMTSEKDRAENVMITDLVRNDLSRICEPGKVEVEALCEIRSYSHVHQMISTITGILKPKTTFKEIIDATFPMGSMTGAPKVAVMQAIEQYENFKRGLYSGAVGYTFNGNADLNVVIRSIQYNPLTRNLTYHVGGAITYDSFADEEWEECLAKAAAIRKVLQL